MVTVTVEAIVKKETLPEILDAYLDMGSVSTGNVGLIHLTQQRLYRLALFLSETVQKTIYADIAYFQRLAEQYFSPDLRNSVIAFKEDLLETLQVYLLQYKDRLSLVSDFFPSVVEHNVECPITGVKRKSWAKTTALILSNNLHQLHVLCRYTAIAETEYQTFDPGKILLPVERLSTTTNLHEQYLNHKNIFLTPIGAHGEPACNAMASDLWGWFKERPEYNDPELKIQFYVFLLDVFSLHEFDVVVSRESVMNTLTLLAQRHHLGVENIDTLFAKLEGEVYESHFVTVG